MSGDPRQPRLSLRIRPAPPTAAAARVWVYDGPDMRRFPRCKGPDLPAALIRQRAGTLGVPVREVRRRPDDLDGSEVWLVNALHGIRAVTAIAGGKATAAPGAGKLAPLWLRWLDSIAAPVTATATDPATATARQRR